MESVGCNIARMQYNEIESMLPGGGGMILRAERGERMILFFILLLLCLSGFFLFAEIRLPSREAPEEFRRSVSVIIPARNEEKNLPNLLASLKRQTFRPDEVLVIDDFSTDRTAEIAGEFGAKVIGSGELPDRWTGKNWALWNGFLHSAGDILVFLDADVRLAPDALASLVQERERTGGAISVVPFHEAEKFYERLSLVLCILGVFSFTSPFERKNARKGLYGSCIVAARSDYEKINGHNGARSELMDDLTLGNRLSAAGVRVDNYLGAGLVSFRMYPGGLRSEIEGFGKSALLGAAALRPATVCLVALWAAGLICCGVGAPILLLLKNPFADPFLAGYLLYAAQIFYFRRDAGRFGIAMPLLHFLPSLFFLTVVLYSAYRVEIKGSVAWKGRQIPVGKEGRK